jgi:hypothetical protein
MSKKSRTKSGNTPSQRYTWKTVATFNRYEEAAADKDRRGLEHIKVKRRGDQFEVRIGTPIKKQQETAEEEVQ